MFLVGWYFILQSISNYDYNTHKGPYIGYYVHHNYQKTYRLIPPLINRLTYRQVVPPPPARNAVPLDMATTQYCATKWQYFSS